jgi:hypothetical protein
MPQISTVKNAVQGVVKKDRLLKAIFASGKSVLISFGRTLYAFWLQMTGLIYLVLTGSGVLYLVRQYRLDHFANHLHLWVATTTTLVCLYFTALSYMKAKRTMRRN